jgi:hypothetical protein
MPDDMPVYDPPSPYDPPAVVVVAEPPPPPPPASGTGQAEIEDEIDAALEFEAAEAVVNEERHEEIIECLNQLESSSAQQREALQALAQSQTESPLLLQIQQQQSQILMGLSELNQKLSMASKPNPSSKESPPAPAEPEKTEDRTAEAPADHPVPAAPRKPRLRTI